MKLKIVLVRRSTQMTGIQKEYRDGQIYRVPRPDFGKNMSEKDFHNPFFI